MSNLFNIERAFKMKAERGWDRLYVAIDLHATLIKPFQDTMEFYPCAVEVMKWFNSRPDFRVILWTSSYHQEIRSFVRVLVENGICIDYVNNNSTEKNSKWACFDNKFYFNILLDDKAGFEGETDWLLIKKELIRIGEWNRNMKADNITSNMKRSIYVGKDINAEVSGTNTKIYLTYGLTGYITQGGTFIPDDGNIPAVRVEEKDIYFPDC